MSATNERTLVDTSRLVGCRAPARLRFVGTKKGWSARDFFARARVLFVLGTKTRARSVGQAEEDGNVFDEPTSIVCQPRTLKNPVGDSNFVCDLSLPNSHRRQNGKLWFRCALVTCDWTLAGPIS